MKPIHTEKHAGFTIEYYPDLDARDPREEFDAGGEEEVRAWEAGEVFGFVINDDRGRHLDSCCATAWMPRPRFNRRGRRESVADAKRSEGELNYRVSLFNRAGKWCGSSCAPTEARALTEWGYLRHPGGRAELGTWDEAAREYVTYRELIDADLCAACGQLLADRRRCFRCDEEREGQ